MGANFLTKPSVMASPSLLDQSFIEEFRDQKPHLNIAGKGQRLGNYLIDGALLWGVDYLITELAYKPDFHFQVLWLQLNLITLFIPLMYYTLFEFATGRTIGKYLTSTKVVNEEGGDVSFLQALGRSLCRHIPLEALSFLGASGIGWHDRIPRTRVIMVAD